MMLWLPDSVNAFRKMALLRVAPRSPRTFAFYEMAPGIMWAVLLYTPTNDLHLSKLAVGQDKDEWNHLERMSEAVSTYIRDLQETRRALLDRLGKRAARAELSDEAREADREANRRGKKAARAEQSEEAREAAREADRRGKKVARAEQSDEAREAAREANTRGKKAARAEQSDEAK